MELARYSAWRAIGESAGWSDRALSGRSGGEAIPAYELNHRARSCGALLPTFAHAVPAACEVGPLESAALDPE